MPNFYEFLPVRVRFINLFASLCIIGLSVGSSLAQTRYVKPTATGSGDGSSWANASADLQAMINATPSGSQVWVAAGTYKPGGNANTDRAISFSMKAGVAIYGGFAGAENALSQRTLTTPPNTILSGDIGTVGSNGDNSNTIISNNDNGLTSTAIIDGFIISDANGPAVFGGGMFNKNSSPTVRNCLFQNNSANFGGGMMNWADGSGTSASPTLVNCSFLNNSANFGGGLYTYGTNVGVSNPVLTNCSFQGNTASSTNNGSAIVVSTNQGNAAPQATNCIIFGTILMTFNGAQPTLTTTNCFLPPNAIFGVAAGNVSQTNNITSSISPFVSTTSTQITDCSAVINAGLNTAPGLSGITTDAGGNPRVFPVSGGTVDMGAYEYAAVPNPRTLVDITAQPVSASLVCAGTTVTMRVQVRGSSPTYQWYKTGPGGVGSVTAVSGATSATLTLTNVQPADAGSYSVVITGCNTLTSTAVAVLVNPPVFVTPGGAGAQNGSSWANAYPGTSLQAAINAAASSCGKQVWVAAGTYKPTINSTPTNDRDATYTMQPGVAIYGGFVGTETFLSQRPAISTTVPPSTTLSADIANNTNVSAYNLFRNGNNLTNTAVLDGFVLAFALANNTGSQQGKAQGGAMFNASSGGTCSPTIRNCWFMNNNALYGGAAIANIASSGGDASPQIENCRFQTNVVQAGSGGAIFNQAINTPSASNSNVKSNPRILNCLFIGNTSTSTYGAGTVNADGGGAISNFGSGATVSTTITGCSFQNNASTVRGGAIYNYGFGAYGASYVGKAQSIMTNCSFQGNSAPTAQGSVLANFLYSTDNTVNTANATLTNCVVFNNTGSTPFGNASGTSVNLSYSLFETGVDGQTGNTTGAGNIITGTSPFASTSSNLLSTCSAAINAGLTSTASLSALTTDLVGNPRVVGGTVDMGAYESVFSIAAGAIAGPAIVPFPIESVNTLTSLTAASGTATPLTFNWQYSQDNGGSWPDVTNSNSSNLNFPANFTTDGNPNKTYQFRRVVIDACNRTATTPSVSVKMIRSNGQFVGKVVSGDGITPVAGVTVTAVRTTTGLAGSPNSWTYTAITGADGTYNIAQIYYGVPAGTIPTSLTAATFTVTPYYTDPSSPTLVHSFSPASQSFTLNETNTPKTFDFTDNTTFGMLGQTRQTCADCITGFSGQTPQTGSVTCPVDGVMIKTYKNNNQINATQSGYSATPAPADYGRFAVAVNSPGSYSLAASLAGLTFVPSSQVVSVVSDVYNINFNAPTSQTIVGRLSAGCNEAIGSAVLEFNDILKDGSNNPRPSCFRKQVTTNAGGFYTIVLPPRKYKVTVISFTPSGTQGSPNYVSSADLIQFINIQTPADSLIRDITSTTAVTTLNLTYQRPPVLTITGLTTPACGTAAAYSLMQQANPTTLTVLATQGATGCPVISGTVLVSTNIQNDAGETASSTVTSGSKSFTLVPGSPNVIAPYYRTLNVQFADVFGRAATALNRNVVVTGVQAGTATFQTVSPQIPLLVLHDPPGDASSSYWSSNTTYENAARFSYSLGTSVKTWYEAKVGIKLFTGLFVITENTAFATLGGGLTVSGRNVNARETVLTMTSSSGIATGNTTDAVGAGGDVFYGTALNMFYAVSTVIAYDPVSCSVGSSQQLIISNSGRPGTDFYYTADFIKNTSIPNLQYLADITTSATDRRGYLNQMKVWQQVLDNNETNKKAAQFVRNKSFGGFLGDITESVTKSVQKSNTIEYGVDIDNEVALALGFEVAGNGFQGGVTANFKAEIGGSETNTSTAAVTTGYTLRDTGGDLLSVDIKTDPIYGTPVFDLLGGSTSCPNETGTLARDNFQVTAPITVVRNIVPGNEAQFTLKIGNISQVNTDASRTVWLSLVSNPDGALIDGSSYYAPRAFNVNRGQEQQVTIRIGKSNASDVYAYEGLQFQLTDNCGANGTGNVLRTIPLSAFFQSPCSSVSLTMPDNNWVSTTADNNQLPVLMSGYTVANLTDITLQYQPQGGSWADGYTLTAAQLNNSPNGTQSSFNTSGLADGAYNLRLRVTCPTGGGAVGTVYSSRTSGIIDRTAPVRFGNTQPASNTYNAGSPIGISYSEALACSRITSSNIVVKSLTTGQVIPVSVGCYQNQISVVPVGSLSAYMGNLVSLTLTGVADQYGNPRLTADSWQFTVGSTSAATGSNALSLAVVNSPISESSTGTMAVVFQLPQAVPNNTLVNFSVSGTAQYGIDYTTAYSNPYVYGTTSSTATQPLSATVNGSAGTIVIPANATSVTLLVSTINDALVEPDETIIISLLAGGDYLIGAPASITAVILNDDIGTNCQGPVTTVKAGSWADPTVWSCGVVPVLTDIVQINHAVSLAQNYVAQVKTVRYGTGGQLTYQTGARLRLGF